jgi:predicted nucleic acid-binding protein
MNQSGQRIYIDSNVFLNFIYEKPDRPDLVDSSIGLLENITKCKYYLVASDALIREIKKVTNWSEEKIRESIFRPYEIINKIEWVKLTKKIAEEAIYLSSIHGIHKTDAIHAAMASMYDCMLVTFDYDLKQASKKAGLDVNDPRNML